MKIRITGTEAEIASVLPTLDAVLDVQERSDFYPNRGDSRLGRVYLDVGGPRPGATNLRASAVRTDREPRGIDGGQQRWIGRNAPTRGGDA